MLSGKWYQEIVDYLKENGPSTAYDIGVAIGVVDPKKGRRYSGGTINRVMKKLKQEGVIKITGFDYSRKMNPVLWGVSSSFEDDFNDEELFKSEISNSGKHCHLEKGNMVHVYEHGSRECNCGEKKIGRHKFSYSDYPQYKRSRRQKASMG